MKFHAATAGALLAYLPTMSSAFMAPGSKGRIPPPVAAEVTTNMESTSTINDKRVIYDPLGLYSESSEERNQGRIQPLENSQLNQHKTVRDPMGLYPKNSPEFLQALDEAQASISANIERPIFDPMNLYTANTPERKEGLVQSMEPTFDIVKDTPDPMGLYPKDSTEFLESMSLERERIVSKNRELFDPLGLYPASSVEYQEGKIKALEPEVNVIKPVLDPMGLYAPSQSASEVDSNVAMSQALPFMATPSLLDGAMVGDAGFDPLGLARSKEGLLWQREAELKHSRIAMLAAAGWPLSELLDQKLAGLIHLKPLLVEGGRVPSLLNGGLEQVNPFYWMGILGVAGLFETLNVLNKDNEMVSSIFDPLQFYPEKEEGQEQMQLAEIKHGRLAMMAITAFVGIEAITQHAVVHPF